MANVPVRHRQRRNVNLDIFTDELHTNVGAAAYCLAELKESTGHDYFSKEDLIIRTAGGGGGVLLVEGTHYSLSEENNIYSTLATNAAGSTKTIYKKIQIIDPVYQTVALYFWGKYFTDYADPYDLNNIIVKIIAKSATFTVGDMPGYSWYAMATGTNAIFANLPLVANNPDLELTFEKIDSDAGWATLKPSGANTISGMSRLFVFEKLQKFTLKSDGVSTWRIIRGIPIADTGHIYRTLYATAAGHELGCSNCPYDTLVGTVAIGEKVTEETSGNTGIVVADSGSVLTLWKVTGTGYWTNNKILTFSGGATALVNTPTTTLNINYPFYHGFGVTQEKLECQMYFGTTAACTIRLPQQNGPIASVPQYGQAFLQVDTNNLKLQMGVSGLAGMGDDGNRILGDVNSYYRLVAKLII